MGFDTPRTSDRPAEVSDHSRLRRESKNVLLALAGALEDIGIRARLVEYYLRPTVLRCWDTHRMGPTALVTCEPSARPDWRWEFRLHPSSALLADVGEAAEPDDLLQVARMLAAELAAR